MSFDGVLDGNDGWRAYGWAIDRSRPDEPVEVEYTLSTGGTGTVVADIFRADLKQAGIGDGRHAFAIPLPMRGGDAPRVAVRIKGTSFELRGSPTVQKHREVLALVAGDIVNNCNLRCPFCVVDYAGIRGLKLMTEETFRKAMELMPLVPPGQFWLSCLHEPTMHPRLVDFIESVPLELRNRISFTSNLSRRLPEDWFGRLARSGVHSLRVSFDSRQPEVFGALRAGARYEVFKQNVERLVAALRGAPERPRLHFITMAFQDNVGEIVDLIRYCRHELGADSHEVRFLYYMPHLAQWGKEHILTIEQWDQLEAALQPLKAETALQIAGPVPGTREQFEEQKGLAEYVARENAFGWGDDARQTPVPAPGKVADRLPDDTFQLRLRWDGLVVAEGCPEHEFRLNVTQLERPAEYFETLRLAAWQARQPAVRA